MSDPVSDLDRLARPRLRTAMWRGLKEKCPNCGEAKLFRAYLKQVDTCPNCGEGWGEIRADDGPAWGTMMVVGHVLGLAFHLFIFRWDLSTFGAIAGLCAVAIVASLLVLPRMKGLFIGLIWANEAPN